MYSACAVGMMHHCAMQFLFKAAKANYNAHTTILAAIPAAPVRVRACCMLCNPGPKVHLRVVQFYFVCNSPLLITKEYLMKASRTMGIEREGEAINSYSGRRNTHLQYLTKVSFATVCPAHIISFFVSHSYPLTEAVAARHYVESVEPALAANKVLLTFLLRLNL